MRAINLIPAEQREGAGSVTGRSGGAALIVLGLLAGVAALAFMYGNAKHQIANKRSELATVNSELVTARAQVGKLAPYASFISMADQRAKDISQLVASRFDWTHAFNEVGRVLPRTAVLTSLHGQVGGGSGSGSSGSSGASSSSSSGGTAAPSASSSTPPGSTPTFQLTGCATSQSEVANTIQRLRLMDGAAEVALQSSAESSSGGGGGGGEAHATSSSPCGDKAATFSATVTFAPLPTPPAAPSASAIVPMQVSSPAKPRGPHRVTVSTKPGASR